MQKLAGDMGELAPKGQKDRHREVPQIRKPAASLRAVISTPQLSLALVLEARKSPPWHNPAVSSPSPYPKPARLTASKVLSHTLRLHSPSTSPWYPGTLSPHGQGLSPHQSPTSIIPLASFLGQKNLSLLKSLSHFFRT